MEKKRAQGVIEFVILFGAMLFFFVIFLAAIQQTSEKKNVEKERVIMENVALNIRDEIGLASGTSEGYYREFKVPQNILGRDYEVNLVDGFVYLTFGKEGVAYPVLDVVGEIQKGANIIKKENGIVYLN